MSFDPNIPQPTDLQSNSQGQIKTNFTSSDNTFGIDHYKFSNATANIGFHNKVTTPQFVTVPPTPPPIHPTTTINPILYANADSANVGIIQYSRGPNNAAPSPITCLQSPSTAITLAPGGTSNVLDFTGISGVVLASIYAANIAGNAQRVEAFVRWRSTVPNLQFTNVTDQAGIVLNVQVTGNILQIVNTSGSATLSNVYWTLRFHRMGV